MTAPSPARSAVTWNSFAAECPELVDPPYGLPARGKPFAADHADDAERYETRCDYVAPAGQPLLTLRMTIDRGASGATRVEQEYLTEREAAGGMGWVDVVDVPQVGDAAFMVYDQGTWSVLAKARTGNAIAVAQLLAGRDVAESWDDTTPLQQQVPVLSPVLTTFLTGLS
ncbi:hypothetical protein ACIBSW_29550 [Actinoplanes sp. NPDC049668]|uniref:hypothetical protein n=1 Tax=unclassified Actinoplanes TaxID=2626549 RepID=UPI0033BA92A8